MDDCVKKPMASRVNFQVVALRGGVEFRAWTDGDTVRWREYASGACGTIPRDLFVVCALVLAQRCESEAHGDDWDRDESRLLEAARNNLEQPVAQAMAWPHGADVHDAECDDPKGDLDDALRFGFDNQASSTAIDGEPHMLGRETDSQKGGA